MSALLTVQDVYYKFIGFFMDRRPHLHPMAFTLFVVHNKVTITMTIIPMTISSTSVEAAAGLLIKSPGTNSGLQSGGPSECEKVNSIKWDSLL